MGGQVPLRRLRDSLEPVRLSPVRSVSSEAWYWLKVGHKMIEITRCPSCGEAVQETGPCDVCFQACWLEWVARRVLSKDKAEEPADDE